MLNILICSLDSRARQLSELLAVLEPQCQNRPASVIVERDDGKMSIGDKRNLLLGKADRQYLAFVDDDDTVSPDYVNLIMRAIDLGKQRYEKLVDCIGMCGFIIENGVWTWQFRHSITVNGWSKDKNRRIYFRTPNHLNPIKRQIAQQMVFPSSNWGEDRAYSDKLRPYLTTEIFIEEPIYFYKKGNK
jgi:hypothetical protein